MIDRARQAAADEGVIVHPARQAAGKCLRRAIQLHGTLRVAITVLLHGSLVSAAVRYEVDVWPQLGSPKHGLEWLPPETAAGHGRVTLLMNALNLSRDHHSAQYHSIHWKCVTPPRISIAIQITLSTSSTKYDRCFFTDSVAEAAKTGPGYKLLWIVARGKGGDVLKFGREITIM